MRTRLGIVFDIVFDLSTFCEAQADDASCLSTINESHVVQAIALWNEANHAQFVVLEALILPDECFIPGKLLCEGQRQAVRRKVELVFVWVEVDAHAFSVATTKSQVNPKGAARVLCAA